MAEHAALNVAVVQMASGPEKQVNIARATELVARAAGDGASVIALPETFDYRGDGMDPRQAAEPLPGSALEPLAAVARRHRIWVLAGSVHESAPGGGKPYNTSVLIDP